MRSLVLPPSPPGLKYPPKDLDPPPERANSASKWLWHAWREAINEDPHWPPTDALGTKGWYRDPFTQDAFDKSPLARKAVGTQWSFAGQKMMVFLPSGLLKTPWGTGAWGITGHPAPKTVPACEAPEECLYASFASNVHDISFKWPDSFTSTRLADGEVVQGRRL